jgi:diaminopimelate decarboxylase
VGESVLTRSGRDRPVSAPDFRPALFEDAGLERRGDGSLHLGGVAIGEIAAAVGTPAFVYHAGAMRARYRALDAALAPVPHRILYAVKANPNLAVLGVFCGLGAGCDIVSGGELRRARAAGFDPGDLVFSGVGKTHDELARAVAEGVGQINVESLEELSAIEGLASARERPVRLGVRVNPGVTVDTHPFVQTGTAAAKFGIPLDQVVETARRIAAHPRLRLTGLAMHVGSQLLDASPYAAGAARLADLAGAVRATGASTLETLDLGGGLGIRYRDEVPLEPEALAAAILPLIRPTGLTLWLEPGRYLVGSAGLLVTRVLYRKQAGGKRFVVVDAGMSDLVRPSHYMAYHDIVVAEDSGEPEGPVDVVGPICESGDFLALDRPLPEVEQGDVLAVLGAGAYGFVMGSQYNSRPRPAEVMVDEGRWRVVRARETEEEMIRNDHA